MAQEKLASVLARKMTAFSSVIPLVFNSLNISLTQKHQLKSISDGFDAIGS